MKLEGVDGAGAVNGVAVSRQSGDSLQVLGGLEEGLEVVAADCRLVVPLLLPGVEGPRLDTDVQTKLLVAGQGDGRSGVRGAAGGDHEQPCTGEHECSHTCTYLHTRLTSQT